MKLCLSCSTYVHTAFSLQVDNGYNVSSYPVLCSVIKEISLHLYTYELCRHSMLLPFYYTDVVAALSVLAGLLLVALAIVFVVPVGRKIKHNRLSSSHIQQITGNGCLYNILHIILHLITNLDVPQLFNSSVFQL